MAKDPAAVRRGRLGGLKTSATHDMRAHLAPARAAFRQSFYQQVDEASPGLDPAERERRAQALIKLHYTRIATGPRKPKSVSA